MVHMDMKIERQLKSKGKRTFHTTPTFNSRWPKREKMKGVEVKKEKVATLHYKGKTPILSQKHSTIKCFRCLGSGHIAFLCPNQRVMLLRDNDEINGDFKSNSMSSLGDEDEENENAAQGESLVIRRALNIQIK